MVNYVLHLLSCSLLSACQCQRTASYLFSGLLNQLHLLIFVLILESVPSVKSGEYHLLALCQRRLQVTNRHSAFAMISFHRPLFSFTLFSD